MPATQCPYSDAELGVLARFHRVVEETLSCRFVRELPKQEHILRVQELADGTCRTMHPHYDDDDFVAFLTHFRKLVANKEPTQLSKVLGIIGKHATADERAAIGKIHDGLRSAANRPSLQIAIGLPGCEKSFTPRDIENVIFNGQVFHTDDRLQEDLRKILEFNPIIRMAFLAYAMLVVRQSKQVSGVLKKRGWI